MPPTMLSTRRAPAVPRRERSRHGGDDRRPQQHERGAVVDEALALDDVDQPPRHAEPPADRGRGDRVGRRDDRAEDERLRPSGRSATWCATTATPAVVAIDEPDREQRDRLDVLPQLAQPGEVRRRRGAAAGSRRARPPAASSSAGTPGAKPSSEPAEHEQDRVRERAAGPRGSAAPPPPTSSSEQLELLRAPNSNSTVAEPTHARSPGLVASPGRCSAFPTRSARACSTSTAC